METIRTLLLFVAIQTLILFQASNGQISDGDLEATFEDFNNPYWWQYSQRQGYAIANYEAWEGFFVRSGSFYARFGQNTNTETSYLNQSLILSPSRPYLTFYIGTHFSEPVTDAFADTFNVSIDGINIFALDKLNFGNPNYAYPWKLVVIPIPEIFLNNAYHQLKFRYNHPANDVPAATIVIDVISVSSFGGITTGTPPEMAEEYCSQFTFPFSGYYCPDNTGFYYCLKGTFASQSRFLQCPPGTACRCAFGEECSEGGSTSPCT